MPRPAESIDSIIQSSISSVMSRVSPQIAKAIAQAAAARVERELALNVKFGKRVKVGRSGRRRPEDLTKWVADRRARRVPKFVIEMTNGLDTKKKIVAKFGEATFEKGKALPKPKAA